MKKRCYTSHGVKTKMLISRAVTAWLICAFDFAYADRWFSDVMAPNCFSFQSDAGWEEYYDYIFPDETAAQPNLKLLAMAKKWKEKQAETQEADEQENIDADSAQDSDSSSEDESMSDS